MEIDEELVRLEHQLSVAREIGDPVELADLHAEAEKLVSKNPDNSKLLAILTQLAGLVGASSPANLIPESPAHEAWLKGLDAAEDGRHAEALALWGLAIELDSSHIDAWYNAGQAAYALGQFEDALRFWTGALERNPEDFGLMSKVIQAQRALGQDDSADQSLDRLVAYWEGSSNPEVRGVAKVAVDQFKMGGHHIIAYRVLESPPGPIEYSWVFAVADGERVAMTVQLESSEYGHERGVPYILGLNTTQGHQTIGPSFKSMPAYLNLRKIAGAAAVRALEVVPTS